MCAHPEPCTLNPKPVLMLIFCILVRLSETRNPNPVLVLIFCILLNPKPKTLNPNPVLKLIFCLLLRVGQALGGCRGGQVLGEVGKEVAHR